MKPWGPAPNLTDLHPNKMKAFGHGQKGDHGKVQGEGNPYKPRREAYNSSSQPLRSQPVLHSSLQPPEIRKQSIFITEVSSALLSSRSYHATRFHPSWRILKQAELPYHCLLLHCLSAALGLSPHVPCPGRVWSLYHISCRSIYCCFAAKFSLPLISVSKVWLGPGTGHLLMVFVGYFALESRAEDL